MDPSGTWAQACEASAFAAARFGAMATRPLGVQGADGFISDGSSGGADGFISDGFISDGSSDGADGFISDGCADGADGFISDGSSDGADGFISYGFSDGCSDGGLIFSDGFSDSSSTTDAGRR
jgi:hypothetical protein